MRREGITEGSHRHLADPKGLGHRGKDQPRVVQRGQIDEDGSVRKGTSSVFSNGQGQPRLAASSRTGEGE
jgi:hypothetical protein